MSSMAERILQDDPGVRRMKMTRAASGSFGKSEEEVVLRKMSAEEEQEMILGGLDEIAAGAGSTGFGKFVQQTVAGAGGRQQVHGYVDENGMPHSKPAEGSTGFANFAPREAGGREDHNYTEQQKVTVPTQGFGAGEGIDTHSEEDQHSRLDDGGQMIVGEKDELIPHETGEDPLNRNPNGKGESHGEGMSTAELMQRIQELLPKEETLRIPPESAEAPAPQKRQPPPVSERQEMGHRRTRRADDSTPDGTQWQSEVVDNSDLRSRDLPDIPEALPGKYVPEKGDGSHPLPNESFEDWGTPPVPGVSQNYPEDPAKLTNIMGSLTRIRLTDGRVIVGKIIAENQMKIQILGRVAGDRTDSAFDLWKRDIVGPREAVRVKNGPAVAEIREVTNLKSAYALYRRTCAKDPKKEYVTEKAIVTPSDGVDKAVEKATNTRGASSMSNTLKAGVKKSAGAKAYDVFLNGEEIDTVFYTGYDSADDVKRSLVDHDGYDSSIEVLDRETGERTAGDFSGSVIYCPHCDTEVGTFNGSPDDFDPASYPRCQQCGGVMEIKPDLVLASKKEAADLGMCQECGKVPAINTFIADNGDEVNYCYDCADYLGAKLKGDTTVTAAEDKEKKITPATAPKDNVATNDTMKDDSFYGDDKALHDQLDKHEKRASLLKVQAQAKLKMADNYEKTGNIKMAKVMDKEATALYNEWKKITTTIAGMRKKVAEAHKVTASARPAKMFFENRAEADKDNPFA